MANYLTRSWNTGEQPQMGMMEALKKLGGTLQGISAQDTAARNQAHMAEVFAANPQFAQQLYGAQNEQSRLAMLQDEQARKIARENALKQLATQSQGLNAADLIGQVAATTGSDDALLALAKLKRINETGVNTDLPSDIQTALYLQNNPELQDLFFRSKRANQIIDTGLEQKVLDPRTGLPIQSYDIMPSRESAPEYKAAQTAASEQAKLDVAKEAAAPAAVSMLDNNINIINDALGKPGFDANFGITGVFPNAPGSDAADAATYIDQIRGGAFLTAIGEMKGSGSISEREGAAATAAVTRLQNSQSPESARQALADLKDVLEKAKARAVKGTSLEGGTSTPQKNKSTPVAEKTINGQTYIKDANGKWFKK